MKANTFNNHRIVYLDTNTDLHNLKKNSYLRFGDDSYKIQLFNKVKKQFDYQSIDDDIIVLPREALGYLMHNDLLCIEIPTYYLSTIFSIKCEEKLKIGEIIKEVSSEIGATFMVSSIDENGYPKAIEIQNSGYYTYIPSDEELKFETIDGRNVKLSMNAYFKDGKNDYSEVIIKLITESATQITVNLNSKILPTNCTGSIFIEKYSIVLSDPYLGDTELEKPCSINCEFTPNLELPFAVVNTPSLSILYNETIEKLDKKIKELEDKIDQLNIGQ